MQTPPPGQIVKSSTGLDENIAALLSYIFGWVSGLVFFLMEKDSKLVRFHAMQSILFCVVAAVLGIALWVLTFLFLLVGAMLPDIMGSLLALLGTFIWLIFSIAFLIAWVLCLVRAYQREFFKLPVIGNMAEKIINK